MGRPRRVLIACVAAVFAAAAVFGVRLAGLLEGPVAVVLAVALVLAVPTSRELARRILIAGCLLLGWTPVLWWAPLPVGPVGRVTFGLAALASLVAVFAVTAPCRLLPRVRAADALLPVTGLLGAWTLWPWLMVRTPAQTLGLLTTGWDNVAHFSMVHSARLHGATVDALGGGWQFANYPEGFHAVVASLQELISGPLPGPMPVELEAYPRVVALVVIAATVTVVAGLLALPALRRRPVLATPAAALVATVFLLGPGAAAVENGFGNFVVAAALVCAVALVAVPLPRIAPLPVTVIGGAVVGIATDWVLLLVLAAPALAAALLPLRRSRYRMSADAGAIVIVLVVVVAGCLLRTVLVLDRVTAGALLTPGGAPPPGLGDVVAAVLLVIVACRATRRVRIVALAAVPLVGVAVTVLLALMQIDATGAVSYYSLKFVSSLQIVLPVLLLVPLAHLLRRRVPRGPRAGVAAAVVALATTQVFGLAIPDGTAIGVPPFASGALARATHLRNLNIMPPMADLARRIDAAELLPPDAVYLDVPGDGRVHPILAAQWYLALTDTWTTAANRLAGGIQLGGGVDGIRATAQRILVADPDAVVLVRREYVETLTASLSQLHDPSLAYRVRAL